MEEDYGWLADPRLAPRVPVSRLRFLTLSPFFCSILFFQDFPHPRPASPSLKLHSRKTQPYCFQSFPHPLRKTPRGGGAGGVVDREEGKMSR